MTSATVFPDTTILIQYKPLNQVDWKAILGVDTVKLILAPSVIQEIKDIKNQDISSNLATRAAITLQTIENIQAASQAPNSKLKLHFPDEPDIDFKAEGLDPDSVADLLVASIVHYQRTYALEYISLFTEDQETSLKALYAGVEVNTLPSIYRIDLRTKTTQPPQTQTPSVTPPRETSVPISTTLSHPSPLFNQSQKGEDDQVVAETENDTVKDKEKSEPAPPLLSLADIGLNGIQLPNAPKQNGHAPPVKPVPIVDIIQEPAKPDPESTRSAPPTPEVEPEVKEEKPLKEEPVAETKDNTPKEEPTPAITHSFSFVSQDTAAPPAKPPVEQTFIPTETNYEKADLRLSVGTSDEHRTTVVIHHPIYPSLDDVNKHLSNVRSNFPKLNLPYEAGGDGLGSDLLVKNLPYGSVAADTILQRKAQRIKKYNSALDTYYTGIEKYLSDNAEFDNFRRRSAKVDLSLFNDLPEDLKSLYISIHFPGNVRVYHEENLPERPASPPPPEEPDLDMLFDPIRLPQVPIPSELSAVSDLKMRGRNPAPIEVRWNKGWDVIYSIREIEKNTHIPFNPLYIAFNSFDHATSFRINYRITVASASYEQLGELEIVVRKEI